MTLAAQAIGESFLGVHRAAVAGFTLGLLLTFLGVRLNTRLIRAHVSWWFHDIESEGGLHVHHMVIGVVLMVVAGLVLVATSPEGLWLQLSALAFGAGVALTLDEFALILRLQDVYWTAEGRLSVDAVIVAVCAGLLIILGFSPGGASLGLSGGLATAAIAITLIQDVFFAVLCLLKGKYWTGFFGLFIPIVGIVGAIRLARPGSPWAHKRYVGKPAKLEKAQRREAHTNATWRAWREAFFDLIAGMPHLPSVTATPAAGGVGTGADPGAEEPAEELGAEAQAATPRAREPGAETAPGPAPADPAAETVPSD